MRAVLLLLLVAVLVSACGTVGGTSTRVAQTAVVVTLWAKGQGRGPATTAQLVCDPVSGTLPDNAAACRALTSAEGRAALAPPALDQQCAELYGGPAEARIVGTVDGAAVDAHLSRTDGCAIARWTVLDAVLPAHQRL